MSVTHTSYAQFIMCNRQFGYFNQDVQTSPTIGFNGEYITAAALPSTYLPVPAGAPLRPPTLVVYNNNCDTLVIRRYDSVFYGSLIPPIKTSSCKYLSVGWHTDVSTIGNFETRLGSCLMFFDSSLQMLSYREYLPNDFAFMTHVIPLRDGGLMIAGQRRSYPSVPDAARAAVMRVDSAGNMLWVKNLHPVATQSLLSITQLNSGCFLANIQENRPGNQLRPRLVCFDMNGDTLWSRLYAPSNLSTSPSILFTTLKQYKQKFLLAGGSYQDPTLGNQPRSLFIEFSPSLSEVVRFSTIGNNVDMEYLENDRFIELYARSTPGGTRVVSYFKGFNYQPIDSIIHGNNGTIGFNSIILNDSSDIILTASRDSFPVTQGFDLYFARYVQGYGRRYVHDYCGQHLPLAHFGMQLTADSVVFNDSSTSGLLCIPEVYDLTWRIRGFGLMQQGSGRWALGRNQLPVGSLPVELEVHNYFGCRDTVELVADFTSGVLALPGEEASVTDMWEVYPNPAAGWVQIRLSGKAPEAGTLRLYSLGSQEIGLSGRLSAEGVLDVRGLPGGVYTLVHTGSSQRMVHKLVIVEE